MSVTAVDARVLTPDGPGTVTEFEVIEDRWRLGQKPHREVWVLVLLDTGDRRTYPADALELEAS